MYSGILHTVSVMILVHSAVFALFPGGILGFLGGILGWSPRKMRSGVAGGLLGALAGGAGGFLGALAGGAAWLLAFHVAVSPTVYQYFTWVAGPAEPAGFLKGATAFSFSISGHTIDMGRSQWGSLVATEIIGAALGALVGIVGLRARRPATRTDSVLQAAESVGEPVSGGAALTPVEYRLIGSAAVATGLLGFVIGTRVGTSFSVDHFGVTTVDVVLIERILPLIVAPVIFGSWVGWTLSRGRRWRALLILSTIMAAFAGGWGGFCVYLGTVKPVAPTAGAYFGCVIGSAILAAIVLGRTLSGLAPKQDSSE